MPELFRATENAVQVQSVRVPAQARHHVLTWLTVAAAEGAAAEFAWYNERAFIVRKPQLVLPSAAYRLQLLTPVIAPGPVAPTAPTGVYGIANSESQITLYWNATTVTAPSVFAQYLIYRNGVYLGSSLTTQYADATCTAWTQYTYYVVAQDTAPSVSADSASVTVRSLDTTLPSAVSNLAAVETSPGSVNVTWSAATDSASGVARYDVRLDGVLIGSTTALTYSFTGLAVGAHTVAVRAVDNAGNEGNDVSLAFAATAVDSSTIVTGIRAQASSGKIRAQVQG